MKTKVIKEIAKERFDILKSNKLFNDNTIDKRKWETKFYSCADEHQTMEMYVYVVSPDLIISNAAYLNNSNEIDISKNPVIIGDQQFLKDQKLFVYSVASAIADDTKYTLRVELKTGGKSKTFSISLLLGKNETGELIQQINFI